MAIFIDAHDPRGAKAVALATQAWTAHWPRLNAYYMPSATRASVVYVTTRVFCSCPAFTWDDRRAQAEGRTTRPCYHVVAAQLLDELDAETMAF